MAYEIKTQESVKAGLARVLEEERDAALAELRQPDVTKAVAVHECRKHIKKARALLKLPRGAWPKKKLQRDVGALRAAARALAPRREQTAHLECLDKIAEDAEEPTLRNMLAAVYRCLSDSNADQSSDREETDMQAAETLLMTVSSRKQFRARGAITRKTLCRGIRKTYARTLSSMEEACEDMTPENVHSFRKRAKDLRYQVTLLVNTWPKYITFLEAELHALTDALGDAHDAALLEDLLRDAPSLPLNTTHREHLVAHVTAWRMKQQRAAVRLGSLLFVETPGAFSRRLRHYMKARKNKGTDPDSC